MPVIVDTIPSKLNENLLQSFKKQEKENIENHITPTAKQVLTAKIDYEPLTNYSSPFTNQSQTKIIVLKPNQPPLLNGKSPQNGSNGKHHPSISTSNQLPNPKRVLFSKDLVQVGWQSMNKPWSTGCGFNNIGNTCYLNSTLQAFFHVPAIAQWLVSDKDHREKGACQGYQQMCLICAMAQTLMNTQKQHSSMTPSLITNKLHTICKHLTMGRQEDAHEFLRYLVENMEKAYLNRFRATINLKELDQYSKETTPLNQILGGYLRSTVTCLSCKHESVTFQHFMDLALDISRVTTLNDALAGYFARENLEECDYKCESCKKKVSATKRFSLERAPVVLCIQLKRFNAMMGKLGKQIQINMNLDLQKHLKSGDSNQNCNYRLVSLVTHLGMSANGGHYTAIGLAPNNNYYQFDDSCVSQISNESVLRTNAYLLFYELTNISNKSRFHNGTFSHTEHTYSKSALVSPSSSSLPPSTSFAKPKLPILPASIIRQNIQKQKENETTPPSSKSTPPLSNGKSHSNGSVSMKLFSSPHKNGHRDSSDDDESPNGSFIGPKQPSMPRLSLDSSPSTSSTSITTPVKPKSLVPYETDDEEDESEGNTSKKNGESVNFLRTTSGVFLELEVKENSRPSKEGSTVDKIIVTKATTNGVNKPTTNGFNGTKRNDDTLQQLTKFNHSGYGTSDVNSWNNTQSSMSREVDHDQREDRKRHMEDDDEDEMDMGRVKKVKYGNNSYSQSTNNNHQGGKLPNPFQEQQNSLNQNGNNNGYRRDVNYYSGNGNGFNRNSNHKKSKFNGGNGYKHHNNYGNNYKYNNSFKHNGNRTKHFSNRR